MTQEQIKTEALNYCYNNLNSESILEVTKELIDIVINDICYDYPSESNKLTTCYLIIKEIIENEK